MRAELITAPAEEPVSLAEAKAHLRVSDTSEDALISSLITVAREHVEAVIHRKLVTQQWRVYFDDFRELVLHDITPASFILAVKYIATDGALITLSADQYKLVKSAPAEVVEAYGVSWPSIRDEREAVYVDTECGYGGASAVPTAIKRAMLLLIGHMFENREAVNVGNIVNEMPFAVESLLAPHRVIYFS